MAAGDTAFVGSIPTLYEELLVPLIFAEPARHLAAAVLATSPGEILETAAGTGCSLGPWSPGARRTSSRPT